MTLRRVRLRVLFWCHLYDLGALMDHYGRRLCLYAIERAGNAAYEGTELPDVPDEEAPF
jgi:hypothetical protein